MKMLKYYDIGILSFLVLLLAGCGSNVEDPRLADTLVNVMTVKEAKAQEQSFTGVVSARVQSNLGFRVSGKIVERLVDKGQNVKKGQALMRIDQNDLALTITAKENAVKAANARFVLTSADENRYKKLLEVNAISKQSYDQAKAAVDAASAELAAALAQAQIAKNEGQYSLLTADSDGTIVETLGEPGQVVSAGQTVIKLAHNGAREASIDLPETVRPTLNSAAQAVLFGSTVRTPVSLRQLSDSANPLTRTYEARYVLSGDIAKAPLGSTITVYLPFKKGTNTVEVPLSAITDEGKGPGVWIVNSDALTLSFRMVEIDSLTTESALIKSGLGQNDKIVALGAHYLHEGQKVRIAKVLQ